jgi:hypothetical protein
MLKAVRARGDSASVDTANRMLKELAAAAPQAAKELETAAPPPPPIEELFAESRFGVPDMEAGKRYLAANPLDLTRWTKDLKMEVVMPAPLVVALSSAAPGTADPNAPATVKPIDIFHIEVVPTTETRNLRIRRPASAGPETDADFGYVDFNGPSSPIVYEGTQVVLPTKLKVPAGRYEIRAVDDGKVLNRQEIEVKPLSTQSYQVKRP